MARIFTARQLCEFAMQMVSEFGVHDMGGDADSLRGAIEWMELSSAHILATEEPLWLQGEDVEITIPANTSPWDFVAAAGSALIPSNRLQIVKTAALRQTATGNLTPLRIMTKREWEELGDTTTGRPDTIFIDRQEFNPLIYFFPRLALSGYSLVLSYYATSKNITTTGGHDFPSYAQLYIVQRLARLLGSGPIVALELGRLKDLDEQIAKTRHELTRAIRETPTPTVVRRRSVF
jgi:hypothetical protein